MSRIVVPRVFFEHMVGHCRSVYPHEACGLLAGKSGVVEKIYEMTNLDHSNISYLMDPSEQFSAMKEMRNEKNLMVAIYHSHPQSAPYPSEKDVRLAFYPDSVYIILSFLDFNHPEVRAYRIEEGDVREVKIELD